MRGTSSLTRWMPGTFIVLAVATAAYLRWREITFLEPILIGIGLLTGLFLGLWYNLRWRTRGVLLLISVGLLASLYFGVKGFTRIEGSIGGSGIPRRFRALSGNGRPSRKVRRVR